MNLSSRHTLITAGALLVLVVALRLIFFSPDGYIPPLEEHRGAGGMLARHPELLAIAPQPVLVLIPDRGDTPSSLQEAIIQDFVRQAKREKLTLHTFSIPYGRDRQMGGLFTGLRSGEIEEALTASGNSPGAVVSLLGPPQRGVSPPKGLPVFAICTTEAEARAALMDGRLTGAVADVRTAGLDPRVRNYQILP